VAVLAAVLLSSNTVHNRYAIRRVWGDTRLKAERLLNGADAEGWSKCSAKCGWGTQSRQLTSCTARESRPCWGDGIVGCDGVCGSSVGYDCLHVCGGALPLYVQVGLGEAAPAAAGWAAAVETVAAARLREGSEEAEQAARPPFTLCLALTLSRRARPSL
jgi:hypothetical protein